MQLVTVYIVRSLELRRYVRRDGAAWVDCGRDSAEWFPSMADAVSTIPAIACDLLGAASKDVKRFAVHSSVVLG